jgi:NADH:ubiquinone oxidoreductase subunit K
MYIEFLTPALMTHYLYIITSVLFLAFVGIFVIGYDLITILMSTEIILLVSTLNFIVFGSSLDPITSQIFAIFVLLAAAAETAVAFSIFVYYYNLTETANIDFSEAFDAATEKGEILTKVAIKIKT